MNKRDRKLARAWAAKNGLGRWPRFHAAISGLVSWPAGELDQALIAAWCHAEACAEDGAPQPAPPTPEAVCAAHGYEYHPLTADGGPAEQARIMRGLYHPGNEWCSARGAAWDWPAMAIIVRDDAREIQPAQAPVRDDSYGLSVMRVKASDRAWSAVSRYNHVADGDVDRTDFAWRGELIAAMRHAAGIRGYDDVALPEGIIAAGGVLYSVAAEEIGVYPCLDGSGYISGGEHIATPGWAWVERGLMISLGLNPETRILDAAPGGIRAIRDALDEQLEHARKIGARVVASVDHAGSGTLTQQGEDAPLLTWRI